MIFDDIKQPAPGGGDLSRRRRRRVHRSHGDRDESSRRRRSTFESASHFAGALPDRGDRSTAAWLSMLALLVLAAGGFAFYLHHAKQGFTTLPGDPPSTRLLPFIDPILAPLETGTSAYDSNTIARAVADLQSSKNAVNRDDGEVYGVAGTIASILQEALDDRNRHLQRLVDLGSPVSGLGDAGTPKNPNMTELQRQHFELAVGVSWQRNSGAYRNRVEELWYRLLRLEQGRFREGSASQAMVPPMPALPPHE